MSLLRAYRIRRGNIKRCRNRVLRAEQLMRALLLAWDNSEKALVQTALERMRLFLQEI